MAALTATPSAHMSVEALSRGEGRRERGDGAEIRRPSTRRGVRRTLERRSSPSTPASIPSKYQTYFFATSESRGFNSQTLRFSSSSTSNDIPGPGSYTTQASSLVSGGTSFSKHGMGGFASKTKRFSEEQRHNLGPGSYNPSLPDSKRDFNKAGASSNFLQPIATCGESSSAHDVSPAPNLYSLSGVGTGQGNLISAGAAFKSKTTRDSLTLPTAANPSPGHYSVNDGLTFHSTCPHQAVFKSRVKRNGLVPTEKGPGPADYSPFLSSSVATGNQPKPLPYHRQKHYLCISAPAMPLPPLPPPPGPGHYEVQEPIRSEQQATPGAVFVSTTSRWRGTPNKEAPGPGAYDPVTPSRRKSYLYNVQHKWI